MANWLYKIGEDEYGPVSPSKIKELAATGELKPDHLVRREDMSKWSEASQVKGLFVATTANHENPIEKDVSIEHNSSDVVSEPTEPTKNKPNARSIYQRTTMAAKRFAELVAKRAQLTLLIWKLRRADEELGNKAFVNQVGLEFEDLCESICRVDQQIAAKRESVPLETKASWVAKVKKVARSAKNKLDVMLLQLQRRKCVTKLGEQVRTRKVDAQSVDVKEAILKAATVSQNTDDIRNAVAALSNYSPMQKRGIVIVTVMTLTLFGYVGYRILSVSKPENVRANQDLQADWEPPKRNENGNAIPPEINEEATKLFREDSSSKKTINGADASMGRGGMGGVVTSTQPNSGSGGIPKGGVLQNSRSGGSKSESIVTSPKGSLPASFTNSIGMEFVKVPKGSAWLGGRSGQQGNTKVDIDQDFYLGKYEVTQEEWEAVTGLNPSRFSRSGPFARVVKDISDADLKRFPVEGVSWEDCQLFIERLNKREKDTGRVYRLPKAAEWEYACRGGAGDKLNSAFDFYFAKPTNTLLPDQANFEFPKALNRTTKVGSYDPNMLGLQDMHGNVWEWCEDVEKTAEGASSRVLRGGGWAGDESFCRTATRSTFVPTRSFSYSGFRVACLVGEAQRHANQAEVAKERGTKVGESAATLTQREPAARRTETRGSESKTDEYMAIEEKKAEAISNRSGVSMSRINEVAKSIEPKFSEFPARERKMMALRTAVSAVEKAVGMQKAGGFKHIAFGDPNFDEYMDYAAKDIARALTGK